MSNSQHRVSSTGPSLVYVLAVTARAWRLTGPNALRRLRAKRGAVAKTRQQFRSGAQQPAEFSIGQQ